ncbi:hypothetical protein [Thauera humireducens]|uniref:hypothetical protein n=1 Tax=Thauera humireducens TaxID=1134435 RepID=UPI00311D61CE
MNLTPVSMNSLPEGYTALVAGASGAIGQAFVRQLRADRALRPDHRTVTSEHAAAPAR